MKQLIGTIISNKMKHTVIVEVTRRWKHPVYGKIVKRTKNYPSHVEKMKLQVGDEVVIQEVKPISKTKHFTVVKKLK